MASANVEDLFLTQLQRVRVEIRERVSRAHRLLQWREAVLLSELQQLEDTYRGEKVIEQIQELSRLKEQAVITPQRNNSQDLYMYIYQMDARMRELKAYPDTATDRMRRVELEWDGSLEGKLSTIGSIRVSEIPDYKEKGSRKTLAAYCSKTREHAAIEASPTYGKNQRYSTASSHEYGITSSYPIGSLLNSTNNSNETTTLVITLSKHPVTNKQTNTSPNDSNTSKIPTYSANINNTTETSQLQTHTKPRQPNEHIVENTPIRGLWNLGNTCFMNSVLQCLSHTLPLRQFYVSDEYKQYLNNRGDLSKAFKRVMIELWGTTTNYSVDSNDLKKHVRAITDRFPKYDQHDAHEFMRFLLNELHEEINRASVEGRKSPADNETLMEACARYLTWEDSRISELFGGMLRSEVCCSVCSNLSTVYTPFMDIALPIPELSYSGNSNPAVHLTDCLNLLTTEEILDEEERPYCNNCMDLTRSTKHLDITKLPRFLVIQLKRFSYYPERTKLSAHVKFDETWRLVDKAYRTHIYSLIGIVSHSGGIYWGHYIAYCKHSGIWRCFNDRIVRSVSWEHVKQQEAYILFYE